MKSKSPRKQLVAVGAAVIALVVATGAGAAGSPPADRAPTTAQRSASSSSVTSSPIRASRVVFSHHVAEWNVLCSADHFAMDDPIVFPGQPGMSHMHTFYG